LLRTPLRGEKKLGAGGKAEKRGKAEIRKKPGAKADKQQRTINKDGDTTQVKAKKGGKKLGKGHSKEKHKKRRRKPAKSTERPRKIKRGLEPKRKKRKKETHGPGEKGRILKKNDRAPKWVRGTA